MANTIDFGTNRALVFDSFSLERRSKKTDSVNNYERGGECYPSLSVEGVLTALDPARNYNVVVLAGHGSVGAMSMGSGQEAQSAEATEELEFSAEKFKKVSGFFARLREYLYKPELETDPCPILMLAACNIEAPWDFSTPSLGQKISEVMQDVIVISPAVYVRPQPTKEGVEIILDRKGALTVKKVAKHTITEGEGVEIFFNGEIITSTEFLSLTPYTRETADQLHASLCVWPQKVDQEEPE